MDPNQQQSQNEEFLDKEQNLAEIEATLINIRISGGDDTNFFHRRKRSEPFNSTLLRQSIKDFNKSPLIKKKMPKQYTSSKQTEQVSLSRNQEIPIQSLTQSIVKKQYPPNKFYSIRHSMQVGSNHHQQQSQQLSQSILPANISQEQIKYKRIKQNSCYQESTGDKMLVSNSFYNQQNNPLTNSTILSRNGNLNMDKRYHSNKNQTLQKSRMITKLTIDQINLSNQQPSKVKLPVIKKNLENFSPNLNKTLYMKHKFQTRNFIEQIPIRDSSIEGASKAIQRRWDKYQRMKEQMTKIQERQQDISQKQFLIQEIQLNHPTIKLTQKDILNFSSTDLTKIVEGQIFQDRMNQAATKIQTFFRMAQQRSKFKEFMKKREKAQSTISRVWKLHRWRRIVKQAGAQKKSQAASVVQKLMKGYLTRKNVMSQVLQNRLAHADEYFQRKRLEIYTDSQIKIRYYWLKFKKDQEKAIEKANALQKSLQQSPKKGGKGPGRMVTSKQVYFDKIGPSWGYSNNRKLPAQISQNKTSMKLSTQL